MFHFIYTVNNEPEGAMPPSFPTLYPLLEFLFDSKRPEDTVYSVR